MFIRRIDGVIREAFTQRQLKMDVNGEAIRDARGVPEHEDLEVIADNHPELLAFVNRPLPTFKSEVAMLREELRAKGVAVVTAEEAAAVEITLKG